MSNWFSFFRATSLGFDALAMVNAIGAKNPEQFSLGFMTLLHDIGSGVKEMDEPFLASIQGDVQALTAKIFNKIGT